MRNTLFTTPLCLLIGTLLLACASVKPIPTTTSLPATQTAISRLVTPTEYVCADGGIGAKVWEDLNGDGIKNGRESFLSNICIWTSYSPTYDEKIAKDVCASSKSRTNQDGFWYGGLVGSCGSPERIIAEINATCKATYIFVIPLPDYKLTTPNMVNGCEANFGLVHVATPTP